MPRWTVFDRDTAGRLHARAGRNDEIVENPDPSADAVSSAVSADGDAVAIVPALERRSALVMTIHKSSRFAAADSQPTGFLGVHDQIFERAPQQKKTWWRRILD